MCGSGVPTANLRFAKVFLERFQTAMKNRGVKQTQLMTTILNDSNPQSLTGCSPNLVGTGVPDSIDKDEVVQHEAKDEKFRRQHFKQEHNNLNKPKPKQYYHPEYQTR